MLFGWAFPLVASLLCFALCLLVVARLTDRDCVRQVIGPPVGDTDHVIHLRCLDLTPWSSNLTQAAIPLECLGALHFPLLGAGPLG